MKIRICAILATVLLVSVFLSSLVSAQGVGPVVLPEPVFEFDEWAGPIFDPDLEWPRDFDWPYEAPRPTFDLEDPFGDDVPRLPKDPWWGRWFYDWRN